MVMRCNGMRRCDDSDGMCREERTADLAGLKQNIATRDVPRSCMFFSCEGSLKKLLGERRQAEGQVRRRQARDASRSEGAIAEQSMEVDIIENELIELITS